MTSIAPRRTVTLAPLAIAMHHLPTAIGNIKFSVDRAREHLSGDAPTEAAPHLAVAYRELDWLQDMAKLLCDGIKVRAGREKPKSLTEVVPFVEFVNRLTQVVDEVWQSLLRDPGDGIGGPPFSHRQGAPPPRVVAPDATPQVVRYAPKSLRAPVTEALRNALRHGEGEEVLMLGLDLSSPQQETFEVSLTVRNKMLTASQVVAGKVDIEGKLGLASIVAAADAHGLPGPVFEIDPDGHFVATMYVARAERMEAVV
jgi:hypothetical protein